MSDALSSIVVGAGVFGAVGGLATKELLVKLLGPTADYLGVGTRDLVQRNLENLGKIFKTAHDKLKDDAESDNQVNVRVLKTICDSGRFVEDVITTEYFAGILASSRTEGGHDDSALPFSSVLEAMSADELRLHYVLYSLVAKGPYDRDKCAPHFWNGLEVAIDSTELLSSMHLDNADGPGTLMMAVRALQHHQLVSDQFSADVGGIRESHGTGRVANHVVMMPNANGASLFLRALGLKGVHPEVITSVDVDFSLSDGVKAEIQLPQQFRCKHQKRVDPLDMLSSEVDSRLDDFEFAIDELRGDLKKKADADSGNSAS